MVKNPIDILANSSKEMQEIIKRVIEAESNLLYMKKPRGIINEIENIIKDIVVEEVE